MAKCPQTQCQVSQAAEGNAQAQCKKTLLPEMVKKKTREKKIETSIETGEVFLLEKWSNVMTPRCIKKEAKKRQTSYRGMWWTKKKSSAPADECGRLLERHKARKNEQIEK